MGWAIPVHCEDDETLSVLIEYGGSYFWVHGFAHTPQARSITEDVDKLVKTVALKRSTDLAKRWEAQGCDPIYGFSDRGRKPIKLNHPKSGNTIEVTYLDLTNPADIVAERWEDRQVIRAPRTAPHISTRTGRGRFKLKHLPGREILRLLSPLLDDVESVERDNAAGEDD